MEWFSSLNIMVYLHGMVSSLNILVYLHGMVSSLNIWYIYMEWLVVSIYGIFTWNG